MVAGKDDGRLRQLEVVADDIRDGRDSPSPASALPGVAILACQAFSPVPEGLSNRRAET